MYYSLNLVSQILACSLSSWVSVWITMEISTFSVLAMIHSVGVSTIRFSSSASYFIIQSVAGIGALIGGVFIFDLGSETLLFKVLFVSSMMIKLGLVPTHFWVMHVFSTTPISCLLFIMVVNKLAPLMLLNTSILLFSKPQTVIIMSFMVFSILISSFLSLSAMSVTELLAASSVGQSGWMVLSGIFGQPIFYLSCYAMSMVLVIMALHMKQMRLIPLLLLSLSGLPPFLLFSPKVFILLNMTINNFSFYLLFPILFSVVVSLYMYVKMSLHVYLVSKQTYPTETYSAFSLIMVSMSLIGLLVMYPF
uniref:NADH-ubiquinone oxidoreductase chain 2 n=2 Tax=unclassified Physidae TaxID=1724862 RepID=A0A8F8X7T1_9GAST|nr:NADH dehydrogenase subunit 2 [Physidae sp. PE4]QYB18825.1 NADH dehydrogenase subunit 2 [Physidae sp. P3S_19]